MLYFFISLPLVVLLHLFGIATAANSFGVKIIEFSLGVGPKILRINKFVVKLFLFSGYVKLLDSREQEVQEMELRFAYNFKPWYVRFLVPLAGCVLLFLQALVILGGEAFTILVEGFRQIAIGLTSPTSEGQIYIESAISFIEESSLMVVFAVTALKITALNLLPIPILNGGQAILELLGLPDKVIDTLNQIGITLFFIMLISFVVALCDYFWF